MVYGLWFMVYGLWLTVQGSVFGIRNLRFKVEGFRFRVQVLGFKVDEAHLERLPAPLDVYTPSLILNPNPSSQLPHTYW